MKVHAYAPWVKLYIYISRPYMERERVVDVSQHIIRGSVTLSLNQAHSIQFTLANPEGMYTNVFLPNDKLVLFLCRNKPLQVFTGFLDSVPVRTARPNKEISFSGSCTLKHLITSYWDPWLSKHYTDNMLRKTPEEILRFVLVEIAGWKEDFVELQPLKDTEFYKRIAENGVLYFNFSFINNALTRGSDSSSSGTLVGSDELLDTNIDYSKLQQYMEEQSMAFVTDPPPNGNSEVWRAAAQASGVNPVFSIAIACHESNNGIRQPGAIFNTNRYNPWGLKTKSGEYANFPNWEQAIQSHMFYLREYFDPNNSKYKMALERGEQPGTIRGIGVVYCPDTALVSGGWADSVTSIFKKIMGRVK